MKTRTHMMCIGLVIGMTACQVFDGESTDTSDYECPSLMPIMTPDGSCTASLDEALAMVESMDDPELLISPGDYTVSRAITRPITFRSSRARAFPGPAVADFERIECALVPAVIGHGLEAKAMGLEHEPKIILRAADAQDGIVIGMSDDAHRMTLIGAELYGKENGPALTVRQGKIGIVQSRVLSPIKMTGEKSRLFLDGVRMTGTSTSPTGSDVILGKDYWSLYDVDGSCDDALLVVEDGAVVNAVGMELAEHSPLGLCVDNARATLCGGSIHNITFNEDGLLGRGAYVRDGGKLNLRGVDVYTVFETGIWAKGSGTELALGQDAVISDVTQAPGSAHLQMGAGIVMDEGAALSVQGAILSDLEGVGIWLAGGPSAVIDNLTIDSTDGAGIAVFDATLLLSSSTISNTAAQVNAGGGYGLLVDSTTLGPATVDVTDTTISNSDANGIVVNGDGGSVKIMESSIVNTVGVDTYYTGIGIIAADVCSGLEISGVTFDTNPLAHIILDGSNATLSAIAFNTTGCRYADYFSMYCGNGCAVAPSVDDLAVAGIVDPPNAIALCSMTPYPAYHDSLTLNLMLAEPIL